MTPIARGAFLSFDFSEFPPNDELRNVQGDQQPKIFANYNQAVLEFVQNCADVRLKSERYC
jgi:hypothetical protein